MVVQVLSGKVFLVITGASQGIGKQRAVTFAHLLEKDSQVLLLTKNLDGLKDTAAKLPKYVNVDCESVDLSVATPNVLDGILRKYLGANGAKSFNRAVMVHDAALLSATFRKQRLNCQIQRVAKELRPQCIVVHCT